MTVDVDRKMRHAVQMAIAARAMTRAAPSSHLKRVLGRYVFLYLHDVDRYAPEWRNQLLRAEVTKPTAETAEGALARFRADWQEYQDIRHYLSAKRQPRDGSNAAVDELSSFRLWASVGELSVEALVDDAVEIYVQLSALNRLRAIDLDPEVGHGVHAALARFEPLGEEAYLEVNAGSFASARSRTVSLRQGGAIGRALPLINDVAEGGALITSVAQALTDAPHDDPLRQLVTCLLPLEIFELLRLTIGAPNSVLRHTPDKSSLLALYVDEGSPPDVVSDLQRLRSGINAAAYEELLDWRRRVGAHTDAETPWSVLLEGIERMDLRLHIEFFEELALRLECIAINPGGPQLLMFETSRMASLFDTTGYEKHLSYAEDGPSAEVGELNLASPPSDADSPFVLWVGGSEGSSMVAAVAGMMVARDRDVRARAKARWSLADG